jgi:hypothetical protein
MLGQIQTGKHVHVPQGGEDSVKDGCHDLVAIFGLRSCNESLALCSVEGRRVGWRIGEEIGHKFCNL